MAMVNVMGIAADMGVFTLGVNAVAVWLSNDECVAFNTAVFDKHMEKKG